MPQSFRVSKDISAYYPTSVAKDRLPIFRTAAFADDHIKEIFDAISNGKKVRITPETDLRLRSQ